MRLKNIKGATQVVNDSMYIVQNPSKNKGYFQQLFGNENPIYVEIGMGKGQFIIENAIRYPNINFIGIEKYDSVLIRAVQRLENLKLNNLKLIRMDANEIDEMFSKEIDKIYLNFSDPWPKTRHEKRRLMSPNFLKKYEQIFKDKNHIVFKTDNRKLFEYAILIFEENQFKINDISLDLYQDDYPDNIPTEYEQKFHNLGSPIYMIDVQKYN